jgi:nitrite reductase (NADH) small subunit
MKGSVLATVADAHESVASNEPLATVVQPQWVTVCNLGDIPQQGARRVARVGKRIPIAVFRTAGDEVFALLDACPHRGGPLSQGIVFGARVACPLHNWSIDLCNGHALEPDEGCTQSFACRVHDGHVQLDHVDLA